MAGFIPHTRSTSGPQTFQLLAIRAPKHLHQPNKTSQRSFFAPQRQTQPRSHVLVATLGAGDRPASRAEESLGTAQLLTSRGPHAGKASCSHVGNGAIWTILPAEVALTSPCAQIHPPSRPAPAGKQWPGSQCFCDFPEPQLSWWKISEIPECVEPLKGREKANGDTPCIISSRFGGLGQTQVLLCCGEGPALQRRTRLGLLPRAHQNVHRGHVHASPNYRQPALTIYEPTNFTVSSHTVRSSTNSSN